MHSELLRLYLFYIFFLILSDIIRHVLQISCSFPLINLMHNLKCCICLLFLFSLIGCLSIICWFPKSLETDKRIIADIFMQYFPLFLAKKFRYDKPFAGKSVEMISIIILLFLCFIQKNERIWMRFSSVRFQVRILRAR